MIDLFVYVAACMGLTVLIVWPREGPTAWLRERVLRRLLPQSAGALLDCYVCSSVWCSLLLSPLWWKLYAAPWCWSGCLLSPFLFWLILSDQR